MHYYVDGYNLLFRSLRATGVDDDLREKRETFIEDLQKKVVFLGLDVTVVFDSQYQLGDIARSHKHNLEIVFTSMGETADDYIVAELKSERESRQHIVVTSDNKLAWRARRQLAKTMSVEEFIKKVDNQFHNKRRYVKNGKEPIAQKALKMPSETSSHDELILSPPEEGSLEYYAAHFEEAYLKHLVEHREKQDVKGQEKQETQRKKRKRVKRKEPEPPKESDEERWERLFREQMDGGNGA